MFGFSGGEEFWKKPEWFAVLLQRRKGKRKDRRL